MAKRPNVLLIMADQLRHDWLGCAGADYVDTPHIDDLASRGVRFRRAACTAPICAPSRISLATGLLPHRLGVLDNHGWLPRSRPTVYRDMRDGGYRVAGIGKMDLAKPNGFNGRSGRRPIAYSWGFTDPFEVEGKLHAGRGLPPNGPYTSWLASRGLLESFVADYRRRAALKNPALASWPSVLPADAFADRYIGRRVAEWIASVDEDFPWFCSVHFVGPHNPFDPPHDAAERYADRPVPPPVDPAGEALHRGCPSTKGATAVVPDGEATTRSRRMYGAAISVIDEEIGSIVENLRRRRWQDNTWIIVCADHGEMLGDHGLWTKNVFYDGAVRIPLIVVPPVVDNDRSIGARVSDVPVELMDLHPTILSIAGLSPRRDMDARLIPGLPITGTADPPLSDPPPRSATVAVTRNGACIRTAEWKLTTFGDLAPPVLFDLRRDPGEIEDVAAAHPEVVDTLRRELLSRLYEGGSDR